ncbi:MAG: hypothetical protein C4519_17145 [Desulfobacteraceae bacterium]|nr:MAG: hypothetical protein C4519_17145 [Desulfobacteraceae bacterium]
MSEQKEFRCTRCDRRVPAANQTPAPECCGQAMVAAAEPLDQCTLTSTPEHSRLDDMGDPCDDGRAG